jgi:DNA-binding response OmpR family regulator
MAKVLIVEDDEVIGQSIVRQLSAARSRSTLVCRTASRVSRGCGYERPDVLVLDMMLPGSTAGS